VEKFGFITLHRSILDWEWYLDVNTKTVFIHLLLKANFAETRYKGVLVKRGQLMTGLDLLARETHLTIKQVRGVLKKLEKSGEIMQETDNHGRLITISKYDDYQSDEKKGASKGQTEGKQRANGGQHNNNDNNDNNILASTQTIVWSKADKWLGISDEDWKDWKEAYPAVNLQRQLSEMHQWLLANPAKARKSQWRRFITNWFKRNQERGGDLQSNKPTPTPAKPFNSL